jgi:hypothetical protein
MKRGFVAVAALSVTVLFVSVAGCTSSGAIGGRQSAGVPAGPASTASSRAHAAGSVSPAPRRQAAATVTARLLLPARTMRAGSEMGGRIVVDNNTGHVIGVSGCLSIFKVLLVSARYRQEAAWLQCLQGFRIPVGESSWPVHVDASYLTCTEGKPMPGEVACLSSSAAPPLPPGDYKALVSQSSRLFSDPAPITIHVS